MLVRSCSLRALRSFIPVRNATPISARSNSFAGLTSERFLSRVVPIYTLRSSVLLISDCGMRDSTYFSTLLLINVLLKKFRNDFVIINSTISNCPLYKKNEWEKANKSTNNRLVLKHFIRFRFDYVQMKSVCCFFVKWIFFNFESLTWIKRYAWHALVRWQPRWLWLLRTDLTLIVNLVLP